ncbi:hypothetical protein GPECTOR_20g546 [Gonium pectorale]|uniref:Uncharacterized protein n=1 Tax=Gonium pectorale TaxID=33097 RepID=A0A150GIP5_GONPE|nr:hypothetical protein GPECTOR_20g546 [Gonium pectorale]|eukprot:KXZ49689.1 hypothetical protein GPECTOR_20g546 [Gonium pectorale]
MKTVSYYVHPELALELGNFEDKVLSYGANFVEEVVKFKNGSLQDASCYKEIRPDPVCVIWTWAG